MFSFIKKEHQHAEDSITSISESVLLINCKNICSECLSNLQKDKLSINSLANELWCYDKVVSTSRGERGLRAASMRSSVKLRMSGCLRVLGHARGLGSENTS